MHTYNGILFCHKKEITSFAKTWMNPEIIILSEVSQRIITYITYMWNLKNYTNELIYKTERLTGIENKLMVTKGERRGG